jgi:hypothetical protein
MNANFQALKDAVNALETKVATLEAAKTELESKLAAVSSGSYALPSRAGAVGYYQALNTGAPMGGDDYYNASGGAIDYARDDATWEYTITFRGLGRNGASESGGVALVTPMGAQVYDSACKASASDGGADVIVTVYCYDISTGNPTVSTFSLLYVR